jgi:hypothetical protein
MNFPLLHIFTTKEIQYLAMLEALRLNGVADPIAYVKEHKVTHVALFRLDADVMSTTILSSEPMPQALAKGDADAETTQNDPISLVAR